MATVELKPSAVWSLVRSWVGWFIEQLLWLAFVGLALAFFLLVADEYGYRVPFLSVSGGFSSWIYAAGIYYLIRK